MTQSLQLGQITVIYGPPGGLKSSALLTWKKKLVMYDFDMGAHRAWGIEALVTSGEVEVVRIPLPRPSLMSRSNRLSGYSEAWAAWVKSFNEALNDSEVRTIGIDTSTTFWKLIQDAYLQEVQAKNPDRKQLLQIEFGEPNARMRAVFEITKAAGKDLVMLHHEGDDYAPLLDMQGRPMVDASTNQQVRMQTGKKIPDGFRNTVGLADWVIRFDGKGTGTVEKSGKDKKWVGEVMPEFSYFNLQVMMANGGAGSGT